jgi:hypothetical protein
VKGAVPVTAVLIIPLQSLKQSRACDKVAVMLHVVDEAAVKVISSTAIEGSAPTPSSLFIHRNPIFTFELLFAEEGKVTL